MPPKQKRRRKSDTELTFWAIVNIALVIVSIYIIYTLSLGLVDLTADSPKRESLSEKKTKAEQEHRRILTELAVQEELKRKLEKSFRMSYLITLMNFAGLLAACNFFLYFIGDVQELSALLNWNELLLIDFVAVSFICYGSFGNYYSQIRFFKTRIENRRTAIMSD